jgi:hypothetical protein
VREGLEDLVHHAEVVVVVLVLTLQVGEVARHAVESLGEQLGHDVGDVGAFAQELVRLLDDVHATRGDRADRGGVRDAEQRRHLAEHGAWLVDRADLEVALQHLELALDQDVEMAGSDPLAEEHLVSRQ